MADTNPSISSPPVPSFLYGTAWKEGATAGLVYAALEAGFRGIDSANQRKHYHEAAVGEGMQRAYDAGLVTRSDLFLQTKFTSIGGQDRRLPYDPRAPVGQQVEQSLASSLEHLATESIDSYVLHGPSSRTQLTDDDWQIWQAMERMHDQRRVGVLGISNVSLNQLRELCEGARIKPAFVQNRCFAHTLWDKQVRDYCGEVGAIYQAFSLLTANPQVLRHPHLLQIAARHKFTPAQTIFRFAIDADMLPLTGTTDPQHMREDLAVIDSRLDKEEVELIERLGASELRR